MPKGRTREAVLKAINSPLGFFVLALLIAETTIGLVLIKSDLDAKDKFCGLLLAVGMFVLVVIVVTVLVWFRAQNLTYDRDAHLIDSGKIPYGSRDKIMPDGELEDTAAKFIPKSKESGHG
jgi:hypothetical protein